MSTFSGFQVSSSLLPAFSKTSGCENWLEAQNDRHYILLRFELRSVKVIFPILFELPYPAANA